MAKETPSYTKAIIRRAFHLLIDPDINKRQKDMLWTYFKSRCAFCGSLLDRSRREGHIDHLKPFSKGGSNHIGNRVLACAICNGNEKLDRDWLVYLRERCASESLFQERHSKIQSWINQAGEQINISEEFLREASLAAEEVISLLDKRITEVREMTKKTRAHSRDGGA